MVKRSIQLTLDDASRVSEFLRGQTDETKQFFHPFPFDAVSVRDALLDDDMRLYSLELDGTMVAVWLLREIDSDIPEYGVVVDRRYRRRGFGRLTARLAMKTIRQIDRRGLWLSFYPRNEAARDLYRSVGFIESGTLPDGQIRMEWRGCV